MEEANDERTLVILKPDTVRAPGHVGSEIMARIARLGLTVVAREELTPDITTVHEHYREHSQREHFPALVVFNTSGPVIVLVYSGTDAIMAVRRILGHPMPAQALPGTIRGDFRDHAEPHLCSNLIHASDSLAA